MKRLFVLALALSGCIDFTQAKFACYDAGYCLRDDVVGPTLISHEPGDGAMGVSVNSPLVLTFSAPLQHASLNVTFTPDEALAAADWDEADTTAFISPKAPLRFSTQYTVRVNGTGTDGAPVQAATFTFTTRGPPDTTAPLLSTTSPMDMMTMTALSSPLILAFNERMDTQTLLLFTNPAFDWGMPTWVNDQTARFMAPPTLLTGGTTYTLTIDASDVAGNPMITRIITFTTPPVPDTTPPTVVSVAPPMGVTGISTNSSISLNFSEPVKPMVVGGLSITPPVTGVTCALDAAGLLMTCTHPGQFASNTLYTVTLATASTLDIANNPMAAPFTSTFTTGMGVDMTAPTVVSFTPLAGAQGQNYKQTMRVTFSEPMDVAKTQDAIVVSNPQLAKGTYSWDGTGRTVTFTPAYPTSSGFAQGVTVSWQIGSGATDLAGNMLAATVPLTFRVRRVLSTPLVSQAADGYLREVGTTRTPYPSYSYLYMGDFSNGEAFRSFLYFDLDMLPTDLIRVTTAILKIHVWASSGDPIGKLGYLYVDSIPYASPLTASAWTATAIPPDQCIGFCISDVFLPGDADVGDKTAAVTGDVTQAMSTRRDLMFRLRHGTKVESNDSVSDYLLIRASEYTSDRPTLTVTYEAP